MFSRIFGGNDEESDKKLKQIDTLKVFNDNVSEVRPGEEYRVDFPITANGVIQQAALIVTLPSKFPLERPIFKVLPSLSHPWLEKSSGQVTRAPGLLNFTVHSDLGRVVQAVIRELRCHFSGSKILQSGSEIVETPTADSSPVGATLLEVLQRIPTERLQQLQDSDDLCDDMIEQLPPLRKLDTEISRLSNTNVELANDMLSQETHLQQLRQQVEEKSGQVETLRSTYEGLSTEYQRLSNLYTPQSIKASLHQAAAQSDQQSERVAEQFLNGNVDADQFLESFIAERMRSHERRIKEEKLHRQLQELERAGY